MTQEWRPIAGYEGKYEVSNTGRVRKVGGKECGRWARSFGYMLVRLSRPRAMFQVSRLVATAFIPNPENYPVVNHIDNNTGNDCVTNLEWCTQAHNIAHAAKQGRMHKHWAGKRSPNAHLTDEQAEEIRKLYAAGGISMEAIAPLFRSNKKTVWRIVNRKTYV